KRTFQHAEAGHAILPVQRVLTVGGVCLGNIECPNIRRRICRRREYAAAGAYLLKSLHLCRLLAVDGGNSRLVTGITADAHFDSFFLFLSHADHVLAMAGACPDHTASSVVRARLRAGTTLQRAFTSLSRAANR